MNIALLLTGHDGDCLESPEYPEGPERGEVSKDRGQEAGDDHEEVQPVPRTSQVSVTINDKSHGQDFDCHLCCVDDQECKSVLKNALTARHCRYDDLSMKILTLLLGQVRS